MAKYAIVDSLRSPAATGAQSVTGMRFQPKGIIFWGVNTAISVPEFNDFNYWSFGWTDGTTHLATTSISFDGNATSDENRDAITSAVITAHNTANTTQHRAALTSLNSDGFTLNWTNIFNAEQRYVNYLALGGDEVSVKCGVFNSNTVTGNQAVTGVGFQPTAVIFCPVWNSGGSNAALNTPAMGWTDGTNQGASYVVSEEGRNPTDNWRYQRTSSCIAIGSETDGTVLGEASMVSLDANGFTVNWTTAPGAALRVYYFAIAGVQARAGAVTQPTATGGQEVTGLPFAPGTLLFQSVGQTAQSTVQTDNRYMLGAATQCGARAAAMHDRDNVSPMVTARYYSHELAVANITAAATGTSSALNSGARVSYWSSAGFSLDWSTVDATQRQILYLALDAECPNSKGNLLTGQSHTNTGRNNVIAGKSGTVVGEQVALFNMKSATPDSYAGTNAFIVNADYVEINGVDMTTPSSGSSPTTTKGDLIVRSATVDSRLPVGSNGQILTSDSAEALGVKWATASSVPALVKIEEQTPNGVASVTFSSLGAYTHLEILWSARGTEVAASTNLNLTFNSDTGSNYDRQLVSGSAATASASEAIGGTFAVIGAVAAASATAGLAGTGVLRVFDYRGTTFQKGGISNENLRRGTTSGNVFTRQWSIGWRNTAAVTSVTITLAAGNFVAGSKFSLYGMT